MKNNDLPTSQDVKNYCNKYFDLQLESRSRVVEFVEARYFYFYFCTSYLTNESLSKIGSAVNRAHCTVLHNVKQFKDLYDVDKVLKTRYVVFEKRAIEFFGIDLDTDIELEKIQDNTKRFFNLQQSRDHYKKMAHDYRTQNYKLKEKLKKIKNLTRC